MATPDIAESSTETRSVVHRLKHTWSISNFSHLANTESEYPSIYSEVFQYPQDRRIEFYLQLYPSGTDATMKDYISVYLHSQLKVEGALVLVQCKLSLLNGRNEVGYSKEMARKFMDKDTCRGWSNFCERKVLLDPTKGLLPNDKLTLLLEMELLSGVVNDLDLERLKSLSMAKNAQLCGSLLESGAHSDVVLVLDDGKELKAHKAILSAQSPVFKAKLEAAEGRVVIKDMTLEVAKELLKFLYTGKVEALDTLAEELLSAADKYGLDLLKAICGEYLAGKLATDNAGRLLLLADRLSIVNLKAATMMFIRGHWAEMMLTPEWPLVDKLIMEELRKEKSKPQVKEQPKESPKEQENAN